MASLLKRARDDTNDEKKEADACMPPTKKQRTMPKRVFVITCTRFVDDYKLRGDDPSTVEQVWIRRTMAGAERLVKEEEREKIEEYIDDQYDEEESAKYKKALWSSDDDDDDDGERRRGLMMFDDDAIDADWDKLYARAILGEFVPRRFEWTIQEVEMDEDDDD